VGCTTTDQSERVCREVDWCSVRKDASENHRSTHPTSCPACACSPHFSEQVLIAEKAAASAAVSTPAPAPAPKFKPDDSLEGHPEDLDAFWREHPSFIWGPCVLAALVKGCTMIPQVAAYIAANEMTPYGFYSALQYTVFAVMLSYAFHAFVIIHVTSKLKLQDHNEYNQKPHAMIARSTAAICTELVFAVYPMAPCSTSWVHFWAATAALAVFWDAWFYCAHRFAHENKWAYKFFHKTHHLNKHSNCFGEYISSLSVDWS